MKKVFATGLGFISSIGNSYDEVLESLRELKSGIEPYGPFSSNDIPVNLAGTIKGFDTLPKDPEDWEYPKDYRPSRAFLRMLPPHGLYAYCAIEQALKQAGLDAAMISDPKTGLHTASAGSIRNTYDHLSVLHNQGVDRMSPKSVVSSIAGTLNFCLVSHYKIKGNSCGYVSACASSGHALGYAIDEIRLGKQDRIIVVGAEDGDSDTLLPFAAMRAMSTEKDADKGSLPFDTRRGGFIGTGGAAVVILESEDLVQSRGATALAEFKGWGQSSDGYSAVLPEPDGTGVARSMQTALNDAGCEKTDIDYLNAHATGTVSGDIAELRAIKSVFGEDASVKISATKALTGHGLSLSSILEAGICMVALNEGFCPGTANLINKDPEIGELNVLDANDPEGPKTALSNSSGFGGANVSLVIGKPS